MGKEDDLKRECSSHVSEMIRLMKGKVGYDEDDMIFLIKHWVKIGETFPGRVAQPVNKGKKYGPFIQKYFISGKVTKDSPLAENPSDEPDSKDKMSVYLYHRLNDLANQIYVDTGWGYLHFNQTEGAILRLVWNYRVMLMKSDPDLGRKFEARLHKLHLN
jgi:hypothetical protein